MSVLETLKKRWNYSVESPGAGRLLYLEGNREYTFPIFRDADGLVLVPVPSAQRIHFFFNWCLHSQEFSAAARARIVPRIIEHLRQAGARVRLFERGGVAEEFDFYPELLEQRAHASEVLEEAGYTWFKDYNSIDLLNADYGLEICGVRSENDARRIGEALRRGFPHWHHQQICMHDPGREPGWVVSLAMFPAQPCNSGWLEGEC